MYTASLWLLLLLPRILQSDSESPRHIVVISIDGLRPEFYLSEDFDAPTLREFARSGVHAKAVESVYPSFTYPAHASIVTGVRPAKHGIASNWEFTDRGPGDWFWESKYLQMPTLWDRAKRQGKTTAIVSSRNRPVSSPRQRR